MLVLKKYAALLLLILALPIARFVATKFVLEPSTEIYAFIPQESDFVIEINTRNFVSEIAYQRIFREDYFMEKVYPVEDGIQTPRLQKIGVDPFEKVILFREQWAKESVWIALLKYTNKEQLKTFVSAQFPESRFEFSGNYAIVQLTPSSDQGQLNEHLKKISKKEVKRFTERVNLSTLFNPNKEVNCYIIPKNTLHNELLDGYLSFDFLDDHIAIEGSFSPVSGATEMTPLAYKINPEMALSLRSSLNAFNSIYWFNEEKIEDVPEYSQMAFDYNGVHCEMIHQDQGFSTPFKSYPDVGIHFDINNSKTWHQFFDSLQFKGLISVDSAKQRLTTAQGATFNYSLTRSVFELTQDSVVLIPSNEPNLYFDLRVVTDEMIDNTTFGVDSLHPPGENEQKFGMIAARGMLSEIKTLATMDLIEFQIEGSEGDDVTASGKIWMSDREGQSMVESISFQGLALKFFTNYF